MAAAETAVVVIITETVITRTGINLLLLLYRREARNWSFPFSFVLIHEAAKESNPCLKGSSSIEKRPRQDQAGHQRFLVIAYTCIKY
jgi:hypothetical protein